MRPSVSQRSAHRLIAEYAQRMRRRHAITAQTGMPDAVATALARGDHVAAALSEDPRLITIAAGVAGGSGRNRADQKTLQAIKLLALADAFAEAAFPSAPAKPETGLTSAEMKVPRQRSRRPEGRLKDAERDAEAQGFFAFRALFLIGPDEGPVRIGVSKAPQDQLRLINRHCLLQSKIGFEGYSSSSGTPQRVMRAVIDEATKRGLLHREKPDVMRTTMRAAIELVDQIREQMGIRLLTRDEKKEAIVEFEVGEFEHAGRAFDLGG